MGQVSSKDFAHVYQALGIDTRELGCFMMNTEKITVSDVIREQDLYYADPEVAKWVQGIVSEDVPHVTILYGLLRSAKELEWHIAELLKGAVIDTVTIAEVGFFHSNDEGEDYKTIVAILEVDDNLRELNGRLSMLPHLNTFTQYKPHITLAYVKGSSDYMGYVRDLNDRLAGKKVEVTEANFGS